MKRDRRWRMSGPRAPRLTPVVLLLGTLTLGMATGLGHVDFLAGRAGADPVGSCSTTSGVIVAVDFSHFGGNVERGCSPTPTTGYQALQNAGFAGTGDEHDGPAFICRITNPATGIAEPPPSDDPCITTPPTTAYWSYWHADAGQNTWTFSRQGPMGYEPPPGSADAWTFGAGNPPPFSPSTVQATNTAPAGTGATSTVTPPSPSSPISGTSAPAAPGAGAATAVVPSKMAPAASSGSRGTPGAAPTLTHDAATARSSASSIEPTPGVTGGTTSAPGSGSATTGSSTSIGNRSASSNAGRATPKIVDVGAASARPHRSSGSPLPFAIGAFVVVALAASGGFVAWRRRSAGS